MSRKATGAGGAIIGYLKKDRLRWFNDNVKSPTEYLDRKVRADMAMDPAEIQRDIDRLEFDLVQARARLGYATTHRQKKEKIEEDRDEEIIAALLKELMSRRGQKAINWLEAPVNQKKLDALELSAEEFVHLHVK